MADGTYGAMMNPVAATKAEIARAARTVRDEYRAMMALLGSGSTSPHYAGMFAVAQAFDRFAALLEECDD